MIWPAATVAPISAGLMSVTTPAQGAVIAVSIFMALTTISVVAGLDRGAGFHRELDDRARHRAFDALLAARHRRGWAMRAAQPTRRAPSLPPRSAVACCSSSASEPEADACAAVGAASSGCSAKRVVRASPARTAGCERIARSWRRLVGRPAMWNSSSARKVRSSAEASECVEFDLQMSLANIGSNCGGGA